MQQRAHPPPTPTHVDLEGQRFRIQRRPGDSDAVPLLLCNGIGANLELWDPFLDAMQATDGARGRPVPTICFDAPGVGGSSVPWWPPTMKGIAEMVAALLDRLDLPVVDVLGLSWGGALAQQLTRSHPGRVRRLVLAATLPGWTSVPASPWVLSRMVTPKRYRSPSYLAEIAGDLYGGAVRDDPDWLRHHGHQRFVRQAGTRGYVWQLLAGRRWTSLHWLHRLEQPTLLLSGDDDPLIRLVNARLMLGRLPNARLHVVAGGGHLFLLTRPDEHARIVTDFLTTDDPPGAKEPS